MERRLTFSSIAESYDLYRPGYPDQLFEDVLTLCDLRKGDFVVEIGPGTGKATLKLAKLGLGILGIEPGAEMIEVARRRLSGFAGVDFVNGFFEDWQSGDCKPKAVIAAQSIYWVDPKIVFRKIAETLTYESGRYLVVFGNVRGLPPEPVNGLIQSIYLRLAPSLAGLPPEEWYVPGGDCQTFLKNSELFDLVRSCSYSWQVTFDATSYVGLLRTMSAHQLLPRQQLEQLLEEIQACIETHAGAFQVNYETYMYISRLL